ncbi:MAG: ABC transporter permease [Anaerolineales bacterium]
MTTSLRIIQTVAFKDILDSLRNRVTQTLILGVFTIALSAQLFPLLLQSRNITILEVYDAGSSEALYALGDLPNLRVSRLRTPEQLAEAAQDGNASTVGLTLPENLDAHLAAGDPLPLQASMVFWAAASRRGQERINRLEGELSQAWGVPVAITVRPVYPLSTTRGHFGMIIIGLVTAVFAISAILVPVLLLEERENRTLDAMLLTPARSWQVITGKAMAGMVYGLVTAGVLLAFNRNLVLHWTWVLAGTLVTIVLSTGIGLLLGLSAQDQQGASALVSLVFMVGFLPVMILALGLALPAWLEQLLAYLPTTSYAYLLQAGLVIDVPASQALLWLGVLLAWTVLVYALLIVRMRRLGL